jgi:hypothetical protein
VPRPRAARRCSGCGPSGFLTFAACCSPGPIRARPPGYSPRSPLSETPTWVGRSSAATPVSQSARASGDAGNASPNPWRSQSAGGGGSGSGSSRRLSGGAAGAAAGGGPSYAPRLPRHEESENHSGGSNTPSGASDDPGADTADTPVAADARADSGDGDGQARGAGRGVAPRSSSVGGASVCGIAPVNGGQPLGGGGGAGATSYMRYVGDYILPATHLPYAPHGPAVWRVSGHEGLTSAVAALLREPLERRSRGHAAAQVRGRRGACMGAGHSPMPLRLCGPNPALPRPPIRLGARPQLFVPRT